MRILGGFLAGVVGLGLFAQPVAAQETEVDMELVLSADISLSMRAPELELQTLGYIDALHDPDVIRAITGGFLGRIAVTYMEWSGPETQQVVVPWTVIDSSEAAESFAAGIAAPRGRNRNTTSISAAMEFAAGLFEGNGFDSPRQVIDISGDQPNNSGGGVLEARAAVLEQGIVINGLPVMIRQGYANILDQYYAECIIGGDAAFIVPVQDIETIAEAIRHKLILEIANLQPPPEPRGMIIRVQQRVPLSRSIDCTRASGWRWNWPP
jgi:hypothetical protein